MTGWFETRRGGRCAMSAVFSGLVYQILSLIFADKGKSLLSILMKDRII